MSRYVQTNDAESGNVIVGPSSLVSLRVNRGNAASRVSSTRSIRDARYLMRSCRDRQDLNQSFHWRDLTAAPPPNTAGEPDGWARSAPSAIRCGDAPHRPTCRTTRPEGPGYRVRRTRACLPANTRPHRLRSRTARSDGYRRSAGRPAHDTRPETAPAPPADA